MIIHRVAFAAVALTALITAAFTATAVSFFSAVTLTAARSELAGKPGSSIVISASASRGGIAPSSAVATRVIRGQAGPGGQPELRASIQVSLQSGILDMPKGAAGAPRRQTQLISLPDLGKHARLVSGTCGATASASQHSTGAGGAGPVGVCVSQVAARTLGLAVGDHRKLLDPISSKPFEIAITGIFSPLHRTSPYWLLSPIAPDAVQHSHQFTIAGPLVATPAQVAHGRFAIYSASWLGVPDFASLHGDGLAAIANDLTNRIANLPNSAVLSDATVATSLPGRLSALATALVVTRTQLLAGILTLLVVAGATLSLAVRLLAQRREAEAALLAARGASRSQLARRGLLDAAIIAGLAAVAGPLLGNALAPVLIRSAYAASSRQALSQVSHGFWPATPTWLATTGVAIGCVAVIALPWLRRPPSPLRRRAGRGRQRSVAAAVYANADLAVVALAAGAAWQLTHSAGPVSTGLDGDLSADPVLVVAPVLALVAGALLTLRALPLAARLGDRLAAGGRGLTLPFAAWQISRRTLRQAGPTLVAVLAVAAAVMAVAQRDSWRESVRAQASFSVGADTRVTLPPAAPLPVGLVATVAHAPGVTASTPAVRSAFTLPDGSLATLLSLDGSAAARIIPPQAAGPAPQILRRIASVPRVGVRIPGRPEALRLTARLSSVTVAQSQLFIQVTDAAGIGYQLPAGHLPADGRPHVLTATIGAAAHADYPLRITGFSLQFATPSHPRAPETLSVSPALALATARSTTGLRVPVAALGTKLVFAARQNPGSTFPAAIRISPSTGGGVTATFSPGFAASGEQPGPGGISVTDGYPGLGLPLPAIATRSFLTATRLRIGDEVQVNTDGVNVQVTLLASVRNLPTITNGSPGLLVDQRALTDDLFAIGAQPEAITEWWLRTSGHLALSGLPPQTATANRATVAQALLANPLSVASQQGLLGIAIAAALLAIIGLLVSVATAAERSRDAALLDALGMPPRQVARLLSMEQAMTAATTSLIGLLFGVALSKLIIPAVTLTVHATKPVPAISVQVPWLLAACVALALAAVPTIAVTLTLPRATSVAARIRLEDES